MTRRNRAHHEWLTYTRKRDKCARCGATAIIKARDIHTGKTTIRKVEFPYTFECEPPTRTYNPRVTRVGG